MECALGQSNEASTFQVEVLHAYRVLLTTVCAEMCTMCAR